MDDRTCFSIIAGRLKWGGILTHNQENFTLLTNKTAIALVQKLGLLDAGAKLKCQEIGDGNLNYVFHVTNAKTNKGVIIKQAVPYAKMLGESWPLTLHRATIEANALINFCKSCQVYVPKVYYTDEKLAITVMEDLSHLTIARTGFIAGENYALLPKHLGEFCAKTLFYSSDYYLEPTTKKELAKKFTNPELCKITESFVFTDPFFAHTPTDIEPELSETVKALWNDSDLLLEIAKLKKSFMTEQESLLHGDLHTGSIFASNTETKVIDPEFAFYGPIGFDLGLFIGNLLFQAITRNKDGRDIILSHIDLFWKTFQETYTDLWTNENHDEFKVIEGLLPYILKKTKADSFGFAGCELIRRTIGLAHVKDLEGITNVDKRIIAKKNTLSIGTYLIKNREKIDFPVFFTFVEKTIHHSNSAS